MDIGAQIRQLRKGIDVAVGTPGRFIDLINRGNMDLCMVGHPLRSCSWEKGPCGCCVSRCYRA